MNNEDSIEILIMGDENEEEENEEKIIIKTKCKVKLSELGIYSAKRAEK